MKYQALDVVVMRPENGARFYLIVEASASEADTYIAARLEKAPLNNRYLIREDHILMKVGRLEPAALQLDAAALELPPPPDWELGQAYARALANRAASDQERRCWALLATLKPGDPVSIRAGFGKRDHGHRFHQVLLTGKRYVFEAVTCGGNVYRYPLEALSLAPVVTVAATADQGRLP